MGFRSEIEFIQSLFPGKDVIPLHEPVLGEREKARVLETIESGFVSSVGACVDEFEQRICESTGAGFAVATVNGTAALHTALMVAGVGRDDEVITQPLTFAATANAIRYCGAEPVFLDVDRETFGLSPGALEAYLESETCLRDGNRISRESGRRIAACMPVHIFGHPCRMDKILEICTSYHIPLLEDAAEAVGSRFHDRHAGCFGLAGTLSFNGNKIITAGGGGALITNDPEIAKQAKHLTTTARVPHDLEFLHDQVGYNYRMPNINAALACAQLSQLDGFIQKKKALAEAYQAFFSGSELEFVRPPEGARVNYWLNSVIAPTPGLRDEMLRELAEAGILARPVWRLMTDLPMYADCRTGTLETARDLAGRTVCLPSSVPL